MRKLQINYAESSQKLRKLYVKYFNESTQMMKNQQLIRFLEEIKYRENLNQTQVAERIGTGLQYLSDVKNGRYPLTNELIEKLYVNFTYLQDLEDSKQQPQGRPYYDVDFLGGFDVMVNDQTATPAYFIDFTPYNKDGVCWCNITGRSMEPKIEHGDIIALKEIEDRRNIEYGDIYAIVTDYDLRTVKIVRRGTDDEHLRLIPINKDFDEQEVEKASIIRMYKVVCNIKRL